MKIQSIKTFTLLLWLITLAAIVIGSSREIVALTFAVHDDQLFVNLGNAILQGNWLGDYNQYTLMKGPFYPIFLALNYALGFPLLITQQILYCFSGIALIYALSFFINSYRYLTLIYVVYVFNPIFYSLDRVTREGVYTSLTTLVISGAILIFAHLSRRCSSDYRTLHVAAFGVSLACLWLTRDEGIWIFPCIGLIVGAGVLSLFKQRRSYKSIFQQLSQVLLPSATCFLGVILCISLLNYFHYGIFIARSELVAKDFKDAYGALLRVQEDHWDAHIPVSKEVRQKLYNTSKKFQELRPYLEQQTTIDGWSAMGGCPIYPSTCGDYAGGWFVWAFRDAVAAAGYYNSAPQALEFYRDLAAEVNGLCDQKRLDCEPYKSGNMPSFNAYYFGRLPAAFIKGLSIVTSLSDLTIPEIQLPSVGNAEGIKLFSELTHNSTTSMDTAKCNATHFQVAGWVNTDRYNVKLHQKSDGYIKQTKLSSPDLVSAFNDKRLEKSRFALDICCKKCMLSVRKQGKEVLSIDLLQGGSSGTGKNGLRYNFDSIKEIEKTNNEPQVRSEIGEIKIRILEVINVVLYQHLLLYINIIAVCTWFVRLISFRHISWSPVYVIATGFLVAVLTRLLVLSLVEITSFPGMNYLYLSPCIPLLSVFSLLIIFDTVKSLRLSLKKTS